MKIIDAYSYFPFSIVFIPVEEFYVAVRKVFEDKDLLGKYEMSWKKVNIGSLYQKQPFSSGRVKKRAIALEPCLNEKMTFFVANIQDGWHTLIYSVCKHFKLRCFELSISNDTIDYPSNKIVCYDNGVNIRSIRAIMADDNKWEFYQKGDPLAFENLENYKKRRIKDRLNRAIIIQYLARLNIDLNSNDFWISEKPTLLIEEK
jgi:hypothetical protein